MSPIMVLDRLCILGTRLLSIIYVRSLHLFFFIVLFKIAKVFVTLANVLL